MFKVKKYLQKLPWIAPLSIGLLFLLTGCPKKNICPECLSFHIDYTDSTNILIDKDSLPFNKIKNIETDSTLFDKNRNIGTPNELHIYPLASQSTFVFYYDNNKNDTIIFVHNYKVDYNRCGYYFFGANNISLSKCTFVKYSTKNNGDLCPSDINIQY